MEADLTSHFLYMLKCICDGVINNVQKIPLSIRIFLILVHDASVSSARRLKTIPK